MSESPLAVARQVLTGAGHRAAAYEDGRMKYGGYALTATGLPEVWKLEYLPYTNPHYTPSYTDTRKAQSVLVHLGNYTLLLLPHFTISLVSTPAARYLLLQAPSPAEKQKALANMILVALTDAGCPLHTEDPFTEGYAAEGGADPETVRLTYIVPADIPDRTERRAEALIRARGILREHGYESHDSGTELFVWDGFR